MHFIEELDFASIASAGRSDELNSKLAKLTELNNESATLRSTIAVRIEALDNAIDIETVN